MQWFKYLENLLPKILFLSTFFVCRQASCLRCVLRWGFTQASISALTCRWWSWYDLYFLYFLHLHILYSVPLILVEFLHELQKEWSWFLDESPLSSTILPMTRLVKKTQVDGLTASPVWLIEKTGQAEHLQKIQDNWIVIRWANYLGIDWNYGPQNE